ncbi:MAG TPA: hypothetical protein VGI39_31040, partial [Polyangiaceae bacterium]
SRQLLALVPREMAERFCAIPIFLRTEKKKASTLYVAMEDPTNEAALEEIAAAAGSPVKPMIASPSDIRSAIRVYYADPNEGPPATTREPMSSYLAAASASRDAPPSTVAAPVQAPAAAPAPIPAPPPPAPFVGRPAAPPPPPVTGRAPLATVVDTMELLSTEPLSVAPPTREVPVVEPDGQTLETDAAGDSPNADPELEVSDYVPKPRQPSGAKMVALTLLDGTTLNLPARQSQPSPAPAGATGSTPAARREPTRPGSIAETLTSRDLVSALRAVHHGADASEILGETDWQALFAALLSLLLKKNLIADWEFVEELRNV